MADIPDIDWINTPHTVAAEFERLRARLAEVEAERGFWERRTHAEGSEVDNLRARLAAVEALAFEINAVDYSDTRIERIRVLLRGEGDRPAEPSVTHAFLRAEDCPADWWRCVACGLRADDPIHNGEVCADCGHARDKHPTGLARYVVYCQGAPSSAEMCRCKRYSGEGDRPAECPGFTCGHHCEVEDCRGEPHDIPCLDCDPIHSGEGDRPAAYARPARYSADEIRAVFRWFAWHNVEAFIAELDARRGEGDRPAHVIAPNGWCSTCGAYACKDRP